MRSASPRPKGSLNRSKIIGLLSAATTLQTCARHTPSVDHFNCCK